MAVGGKIRFLVASVVAVLALSACSEHKICDNYRTLSTEGWERGDTICYPIDSVETSGNYTIEIGLRTTHDFPFQKLWLVVEQHYTHPEAFCRDTLPCVLATPNGDITGHGISRYDYKIPLGMQHFEVGQRGVIVVHHIMRSDLLPGISDVGVVVTRL